MDIKKTTNYTVAFKGPEGVEIIEWMTSKGFQVIAHYNPPDPQETHFYCLQRHEKLNQADILLLKSKSEI